MALGPLILHYPFFGGVQRTAYELRLFNDPILPLSGTDRLGDLALPIRVDRDHNYSNPMADDDHSSDNCVQIRELGWRLYPWIHRQVEFAEMLKKKGVQVIGQFTQGDCHGVAMSDLSKGDSLFVFLKDFIECN
ncbi:probable carboxylesterase 120 [Morus notabilis]|uniref:probable carboxylesterase 120 n=1 Tax=Morus notabilis TaxID=981085 RepID=UPI000CECEACF|nr:probable carboxylesterase 120 [Morus notabilis]